MEPRKGILVVDDAIDTLKFLVHTLTSDDQMVRPANGGQQALDAIARQLPELTLLDVRRPGLDGFEVCRRLKADEKTKAIPVQFLSSSTESSRETRSRWTTGTLSPTRTCIVTSSM